MIPELVILTVTLCLLALPLVFLATSRAALEILCQSDVPSWKISVPRNNASPGWITSISGRLAVVVVVAAAVAAAVAVADVVATAVAAALAAQRNVNGDSFVRWREERERVKERVW
jgi:hypothetical protein